MQKYETMATHPVKTIEDKVLQWLHSNQIRNYSTLKSVHNSFYFATCYWCFRENWMDHRDSLWKRKTEWGVTPCFLDLTCQWRWPLRERPWPVVGEWEAKEALSWVWMFPWTTWADWKKETTWDVSSKWIGPSDLQTTSGNSGQPIGNQDQSTQAVPGWQTGLLLMVSGTQRGQFGIKGTVWRWRESQN